MLATLSLGLRIDRKVDISVVETGVGLGCNSATTILITSVQLRSVKCLVCIFHPAFSACKAFGCCFLYIGEAVVRAGGLTFWAAFASPPGVG